ncbi:MAG: hypothetical protein IT383_18525 [Deltaproteobacteria bacterium]|nr:hypothetical protein [Deltaproteobacteria bacterium]
MAQVIPESWQVPQRFRQRVGTSAGRQRAMIDAGHLLLILHDVPKVGDDERAPRLFWRAPDGAFKAKESRGDGLPSLKRHVEAFKAAVQELDEKVDRAKQAEEIYQVLRAAAPIARTTRNLHKALQEAREGVDDKDIISLRDAAGEIERSAELVVSDAKNALDYLEAKAAEEQASFAKKTADAQHRLNLLAALFFPITAIGSVLGIELTKGLESQGAWLFWSIVVAALIVGVVVRGSISKS